MLIAVLIWIAGLLTAVPYAAWHLLFQAPRDQYAWLITFILFWPFGYWGVVGPILMTLKVRSLWRRLEQAGSSDERRRLLLSPDAKDVAIDMIAAESRLPKFVARRVYDRVIRRVAASEAAR